MSSLVGDPRTIKAFGQSLKRLPMQVQNRIASRAAPILSAAAQGSFSAKTDPYGLPWVPGVDGNPVDLEETGRLRSGLRFIAVGRNLRAALTAPYAKYQIGKRRVLPPGGRALPPAWGQALANIANDEIAKALEAPNG